MDDVFRPNPLEAIETVLWAFCVFGILFMIGSMPWVGPDGVLSGGQWLGFSLLVICLFGGAAFCMRMVSNLAIKEADASFERKLGR